MNYGTYLFYGMNYIRVTKLSYKVPNTPIFIYLFFFFAKFKTLKHPFLAFLSNFDMRKKTEIKKSRLLSYLAWSRPFRLASSEPDYKCSKPMDTFSSQTFNYFINCTNYLCQMIWLTCEHKVVVRAFRSLDGALLFLITFNNVLITRNN